MDAGEATTEQLPRDPRQKYLRAIQAAEAWQTFCQGRDDQRLREFREGRFKEGADGVGANFRFPFVTMLLAYLMAQAPAVEVEARDSDGAGAEVFGMLAQLGLFPSADEGRAAFADGFEQLLTHSYEVANSDLYNKVALFRALVVGCGIVKVGWDQDLGLDRIDAVERQDLFCDPQAKYTLAESSYVVQTCAWPMERAEAFFKQKLNASIEPNYQLSEASGIMGQAQKQHAPQVEQPDMFRFHEVWCKEGEQRLVYYYAARTRELIGEPVAWPFVLQREEFPFCQLSFNTQYLQALDGFSELEVTRQLRDQHEEGMAYQGKHVGRSRAKKVLYDEDVLSPEALAKLLNPKDMEFVGVKGGGKDLNTHVRLLDFNSDTDSDLERTGIFKQSADEIDGQDELVRGAASQVKMTATEAAVKDSNSKLRTGRRTKIVDEFLTEQTRKRAMVARQLISAETVAKVAGPKAGLVWSVFAPNPEDLMRGYSIGITAGSTSEQHKRERIERIDRFLQLGDKINSAYQAAVVNMIELAKDRQKIDGFRRVNKYFNEALVAQLTAPPPPMLPPGLPGAVPNGAPVAVPGGPVGGVPGQPQPAVPGNPQNPAVPEGGQPA